MTAIGSNHSLTVLLHTIYKFLNILFSYLFQFLQNSSSNLSFTLSSRVSYIQLVFKKVPNILNGIEIWRVWRPN